MPGTARYQGLLHTLSRRELLPREAQSYTAGLNNPALQRRTNSLHASLPKPEGLTWIHC